MSELTTWLLEQIAADEAVARAAEGWATGWTASDQGNVTMPDARLIASVRPPNATHIARHDPARVLADCAAKRQQIAHLIDIMDGDYAPWNETQLRIMTSVYANHTDYREEWKP